MSLGYNDRLKPLKHKGECGDQEFVESEKKMKTKAIQLSKWIQESKHTVIFTGAGISTSSGIPDFRGPTGVWTCEKEGKLPTEGISFENAIPSLTHMALVGLYNSGLIQFIVSQNVDGLHLVNKENILFFIFFHRLFLSILYIYIFYVFVYFVEKWFTSSCTRRITW
jgi:mono-ADP-ribosyltransferase sirtuin 6